MDKAKEIIIQVENLKEKGKYEEAIKILEKYIAVYNSDYRLYEELADIYLYKGNLEKALKSVVFALNLNEQSATGNYLKGFILLSQDKVVDAIRYLEMSNELMGNNAEVLRNLGWAYTMLGEAERGISILKRALVISPDDNLITEDLAMALIGIGSVKEGNELLQKIGKNVTN